MTCTDIIWGDVYLRQIGRQIEFSGEKRFISARMGGDEFSAFLYGYASKEEAEKVLRDFEAHRGEVFMDPENETLFWEL